MKYKSRPQVIDAFRFDEDWEASAPDWFIDEVKKENVLIDYHLMDGAVRVYGCSYYVRKKNRYTWRIRTGDYIIRDESGRITKCNPQEFDTRYERVEE